MKKGRLKALKSAVVNQEMQDLVKVSHQDLKGFPVPEAGDPQNGSFFDKVLVDAPCSGSGVLSRRSDMRWRRVESDLQDLNVLQVCISLVHLLLYKGIPFAIESVHSVDYTTAMYLSS